MCNWLLAQIFLIFGLKSKFLYWDLFTMSSLDERDLFKLRVALPTAES